jgi:hypothetical protein
MRGSILALAGGAICLVLGTSDGHAGAIRANPACVVPPAPGSGTPNSCGVQVPMGTTQVDPPGNIVSPDATFVTGTPINYSTAPGTGDNTSFSSFLGIPGYVFSNPSVANQDLASSVIEFDGTFVSHGAADMFSLMFSSFSFVQLFVDNENVTLAPYATNYAFGTDPMPLTAGDTYSFVLDFYTGDDAGGPDPTDPTFVQFQINGVTADDTVVGGTAAVPEPASLSLFAAGLAGLAAIRRRRKRG